MGPNNTVNGVVDVVSFDDTPRGDREGSQGRLERSLDDTGHGKVFAFSSGEMGCVDLTIVEPMVIFTVPHVPWNLKPIPVPRTHIP